MANWFTINDTALDPDAPLTSELAYAWRDNPIAIAEGATGAPRIYSEALRNISSGTAVTLFNQSSTVTLPSNELTRIVKIGVLAGGSFTVNASSAAVSTTVRIRRVRNGNSTTVASATAGSTGATSVTFQSGDVIVVDVNNIAGAQSSALSCLITANNDSPRFVISDMINA